MTEISTKEAAVQLDVGFSTMKAWCDKLPIPLRTDAAGARRIGPEGLAILEQVKQLRDQGRHLESIRVILAPAEPEPGSDPASVSVEPGPSPALGQPGAEPEPGSNRALTQGGLAETVAAAAAAAVEAAIGRETELAEKYARAAHRIGELEATVRGLEGQLAARLEPGPSPDLAEALVAIQGAAEREVSLRIRLVDQLAAAERRELEVQMAGLERELAEARAAAVAIATAPKPWWRFWGS